MDFDRELYEDFYGIYPSFHERHYALSMGMFCGAIATAFTLILGLYMMGTVYYSMHFYPNSYINGIDVSDMTGSEARALVSDGVSEDYSLLVHLKSGDVVLHGSDIRYMTEFTPGPSMFVMRQDPFCWPVEMYSGKRHEYETVFSSSYNDMKMVTVMAGLSTEIGENRYPSPGYLEDNEDGSMTYVAGTPSTRRDAGVINDAIRDAISRGLTEIDLSNSEAYAEDTLDMEREEALRVYCEEWNLLLDTELVYRDAEGRTVTIPRDQLLANLKKDDISRTISINSSFVDSLAEVWSGRDDEESGLLYYHGTALDKKTVSRVWARYLVMVRDKLLRDLTAHSTDGMLPRFDIGALLESVSNGDADEEPPMWIQLDIRTP